MPDLLRQIGIKIRGYRKSVGMTQAMLAAKAKLHTTYISEIERGKAKNLSIVSLYEIGDVLNVNLGEMLDFSDRSNDEVEERIAGCMLSIKKQDRKKQGVLLGVLEKMIEEFEEL